MQYTISIGDRLNWCITRQEYAYLNSAELYNGNHDEQARKRIINILQACDYDIESNIADMLKGKRYGDLNVAISEWDENNVRLATNSIAKAHFRTFSDGHVKGSIAPVIVAVR